MKRKERWLALIRTDEPNDRKAGSGESMPATVLIPMIDLESVLTWYAAMSSGGKLPMLPRDFEMTFVPGPEGDQ